MIAEASPDSCEAGGRNSLRHASLTVESVDGLSAATTIQSSNPLKLLVPQPRAISVWACCSSFGGGFVAGDQTQLNLKLGPSARCFLGTQASTKVYRNPEQRPCGHVTSARLEADAVLVFAPDPVQPFADSSYQQDQEFDLAEDSSLALLDWFSAGRSGCGERWQMRRFKSRNAVYRRNAGSATNRELVFLDSLLLDANQGLIGSKHRTGRFNCFAILLLLGPAFEEMSARILAEVGQAPVRRSSSLLRSTSPVREGVVLRVAGEEVESVGRELHRQLSRTTTFLGDDPWARKW